MIFLLLVALTESSVAGDENEAVILDTNWDPVKANTPYRVRMRVAGQPGYLSRQILALNATSCREGAVAAGLFPGRAEPVIMLVLPSSSSADDVVPLSTELSVKFTNPSHCNESGFLRVSGLDKETVETVLTDGSKSRSDSTFTIRKASYITYKFSFGSSVDLADNSTEIVGVVFSISTEMLITRRAAENDNISVQVDSPTQVDPVSASVTISTSTEVHLKLNYISSSCFCLISCHHKYFYGSSICSIDPTLAQVASVSTPVTEVPPCDPITTFVSTTQPINQATIIAEEFIESPTLGAASSLSTDIIAQGNSTFHLESERLIERDLGSNKFASLALPEEEAEIQTRSQMRRIL
ncbi:unnamed protein product [Microthlaspi erraticum]|uniref:Uncharacterized protein n=1 Tax=Microthlaspi erraticum TaxID=1685480 RepID=A0A6D2LET6_9BRAS|nr:unnamed protein product [Microthlaspi erraticum]